MTSRGLQSESTCVLKAKPGKIDIKRHDPVLYLPVYPLFHSNDVMFDFCVDSASLTTSFKKCNVIMT